MKTKDIRTLCYKCFMDMYNAGIKLHRTKGARSKCDKCNKPGSSYIINN